MTSIDSEEISSIVQTLVNEFGPLGFEFQPFKVGWYNRCVSPVFHLKQHEDTVALLIISTPSMFEKAFVPYLKAKYDSSSFHDPIDECMIFHLTKMKGIFPHLNAEIIHDFEMHPNRRPKVLMQTAAHVSGAAFFYQRSHLVDDDFGDKKVYGVCIHPKYGGWFALRGVILFHGLLCPSLLQTEPKDVVWSEKWRLQLLEMYNNQWEDWKFRDIIPACQKYSPLAMKYFSMLPKDRFMLIRDIASSYNNV